MAVASEGVKGSTKGSIEGVSSERHLDSSVKAYSSSVETGTGFRRELRLAVDFLRVAWGSERNDEGAGVWGVIGESREVEKGDEESGVSGGIDGLEMM